MASAVQAAGLQHRTFLHWLVCCLLLNGVVRTNEESGERGTLHGLDFEVTYPRWSQILLPALETGAQRHPAELVVWITVEGQDLQLQLYKNQELLSPAFQEVWYSPEGRRLSTATSHQNHCFYHGSVRFWKDSSVAVSTCSGIRGIISLNASLSYIINPLANQTEPWGHAIFLSDKLKLPLGECHHYHGNKSVADSQDELIGGESHQRERRDISRNMKYVELLLVADYAEFVKRGQDREKVKMALLEAANHVDQFYKALGIRVALTGLEVWSSGDQVTVSDNPFSTLHNFLSWRHSQLPHLPNDNAQLVTGRSFQGTTIGLAPLKAMCSDYQSGGINSDHSESVFGVAATLAHELGHNLGMSHDGDSCCHEQPELGGCIMAAATGSPFPRVFNACNRGDLQRFLAAGGGKCLSNPPNPALILGGHRCGNGYLEEGEECDCGQEEECTNPCCNASNCTLREGAQCAHGVCCHNCKLRRAGEICRPATGSCDLPEFCDGTVEACPDDHFLLDGSACHRGGGAYCYTGMCLTHTQQCISLWGPGSRAAPELCFREVNQAGDQFGNCGKDPQGRYRHCSQQDALCGKIQCVSGAERPMGTNAVAIPTTVRQGGVAYLCKGTHVYQPHVATGNQPSEDTLDPGLVMTGTRCAVDKICFSGVCRNVSFLGADQCQAKCHGHGVCNNKHHCHCDAGWAPPFCSAVGEGGSVDSGPVGSQGTLLPVLLLLLLFALVALAAGVMWYRYKHRLRPFQGPPLPLPGTNKRCSRASFKGAEDSGHTNPTFQVRIPDIQAMGTPRSSHAPVSRHAVVRPTSKPPPIPAYARNTHAVTNTSEADGCIASEDKLRADKNIHDTPSPDAAPKQHQVKHTLQSHTSINTPTSPSSQAAHKRQPMKPIMQPHNVSIKLQSPPIPSGPPPIGAPPTRPPPPRPIRTNQEREVFTTTSKLV